MFAIAEKAYNHNPDQPYLKAMYAFALGEVRNQYLYIDPYILNSMIDRQS